MLYSKRQVVLLVIGLFISLTIAGAFYGFAWNTYSQWTSDKQRLQKIEASAIEFNTKADALQKQIEDTHKQIEAIQKQLNQQREIYPVSRGSTRFSRVYTNCEVTWYTDYGKTATGTTTVHHRTVAVDPSVVPLGSRMLIILPDGTEYWCIAEDTGGAVVGLTFDIYTADGNASALRRGRVTGAKVYILQ